jgi:hypothetical protein
VQSILVAVLTESAKLALGACVEVRAAAAGRSHVGGAAHR